MLFSPFSYQDTGRTTGRADHPGKIRILMADDHPVFRAGFAALMQNYPGIELMAQFSNGRQLVEGVKQMSPDIVLTDLRMPELDGMTAIAEIRKFNSAIPCIAISEYHTDYAIFTALKAGAMGFLLKTSDGGEIINAIMSVHRFNPYYCHYVARKVKSVSDFKQELDNRDDPELTDKEKRVIRLICEDKSSKQIGREMFISSRTVEGHKQRIKSKIGTHTTVGIVLFAVLNGLYKPPGNWFL